MFTFVKPKVSEVGVWSPHSQFYGFSKEFLYKLTNKGPHVLCHLIQPFCSFSVWKMNPGRQIARVHPYVHSLFLALQQHQHKAKVLKPLPLWHQVRNPSNSSSQMNISPRQPRAYSSSMKLWPLLHPPISYQESKGISSCEDTAEQLVTPSFYGPGPSSHCQDQPPKSQ